MNEITTSRSDGRNELLWSERYGQHFHDRNDPERQSEQVFLRGSGTDQHLAPRVLEIGFGLGLNFRITLRDCLKRGVALHYIALEHDPQTVARLAASAVHTGEAELPAWQQLLACWPTPPCCVKSPEVQLEVHFQDAVIAELPQQWASAIYLDGFSSTVNPELWSDSFIAKLAQSLSPGGWLTTYSAAGHVRRALKAAGLQVERGPGWGTKWQFLRAQRPFEDNFMNSCR